MPIQMAYYCPKYGRPACGGKCLSLKDGDCLSGVILDKEGGNHNFRTDPKFWGREVETWGLGSGKPRWPANFGEGSCAYDYSALFNGPTPAPQQQDFTYKKEKFKTCEWLGQLTRDAISSICSTRTKAPAASSTCPRTCSLTQLSWNAEAQNKYLHRTKTKRSCDWLNKRGDRAQICSKNRNARGNCATVCKTTTSYNQR